MNQREIKTGIYLVVDPSMDAQKIISALESALRSDTVAAIQVWDHWPGPEPDADLLLDICRLAHAADIPVLVNNQWHLLADYPLDGVHFDVLPADLPAMKQTLGRPVIVGVTLGNDLRALDQQVAIQLDYLSFCSMFPSPSAQQCEIVRPEAVIEAKTKMNIPLFLAGGIRADNLAELAGLPFDGIAVISDIMHAENPEQAARELYQIIQKLKIDTI